MVLALHDAALTGAVLALAIMLLGCAFLLILRTPKRPYGLRFLLLTVAVMAVAFGVWAALLRSSGIFSLPQGEGGPVTAPHAPSDRKPESNGALPSFPD